MIILHEIAAKNIYINEKYAYQRIATYAAIAFFQLQIKCFWQYKEIQFALDDLPLAMNHL